MGIPVRPKKQKKRGHSKPPGPVTTTWLDDDFYESTHRPHSYSKSMTRYYVFTAEGKELYCFKKKEDAELQVSLIDGTWLYCFEPSEEVAHELRQQEKATQRWEAGYGA